MNDAKRNEQEKWEAVMNPSRSLNSNVGNMSAVWFRPHTYVTRESAEVVQIVKLTLLNSNGGTSHVTHLNVTSSLNFTHTEYEHAFKISVFVFPSLKSTVPLLISVA